MSKVGVSSAFREWTRGTSFVLSMGKSQVAALVSLYASQNMDLYGSSFFHIGWNHKLLRNWTVVLEGLRTRGLLITDIPSREEKRSQRKTGERFIVTEAGKHVVELLKIAGIYQELVEEFTATDRRARSV